MSPGAAAVRSIEGPTLRIRLWAPPGLEGGADCRSRYAETYWLPVVGPTAFLIGRRLADGLERVPGDELCLASVENFARLFGVSGAGGHSAFWRALGRLVDFRVARVQAEAPRAFEFCPTWGQVPFAIRRRWSGLLGAMAEAEHREPIGA